MTERRTATPTPPPPIPPPATATRPRGPNDVPPPPPGPAGALRSGPVEPVVGDPRRPWRERIPELVGGIGTVLVVAAVIGFVSATWEELDRYGRALVLLAASGGLSAAALFVEQRGREQLAALTSMLWLAGAATLGASATLALTAMAPDAHRVAIGIAGLLAAGYSALAVRRSPTSSLRQLGVAVSLVYAAGPFGTAIGDGYGIDDLDRLVDPVLALVLRAGASDAFALTGALHLAIGAGWLAWAHRATGRASRVAMVGATSLLAFAALELHALPTGIGAFGALLVVLGYLVFGLVAERGGAVAVGATGVLIAGSRVLWSLFSGEVATTIASFTVGLALLAWAVRARGERADEQQVEPAADADAPAAPAAL